MLEYIYFVKCPNCEDEHFDFFNEAKEYAMSLLSKKPIITQIEVDRNDFGECIDSCDLGTVWSWEEVTKDVPTESETVFNKAETFCDKHQADPEFATLDNSLNVVSEEFEVGSKVFCKANKKSGIVKSVKGDTVEVEFTGGKDPDRIDTYYKQDLELTEAVNSVHDELISRLPTMTKAEFKSYVESKGTVRIFAGDPREFGIRSRDYEVSFEDGDYVVSYWEETYMDEFTDSEVVEVFASIDELWDFIIEFMEDEYFMPEYNYIAEACTRKPVPEGMSIKDLVEEMEENEDTVECTWCEELFDKSECRKEVNLGWLCDRCQAAIMSRGEQLTFKENSYWDFLDEDVSDDMTLADLVKDSINHLVNDLGKDSSAEDFVDDVIGDLERNYINVVPEDPVKYKDWCSSVACEVSRQLNKQEGLTEAFDRNAKVEFTYDGLKVTLQGPKRDVDDWDEAEESVRYSFRKKKDDVATDIWENFIEEVDAKDVEGGLDTLEDDRAWYTFLETHFDDLLDKYYDKLLKYYEDDAREEYQDTHSLGECKKSFLEELEEPEDYKARLSACPECGIDESFDHETGICINCGFNI